MFPIGSIVLHHMDVTLHCKWWVCSKQQGKKTEACDLPGLGCHRVQRVDRAKTLFFSSICDGMGSLDPSGLLAVASLTSHTCVETRKSPSCHVGAERLLRLMNKLLISLCLAHSLCAGLPVLILSILWSLCNRALCESVAHDGLNDRGTLHLSVIFIRSQNRIQKARPLLRYYRQSIVRCSLWSYYYPSIILNSPRVAPPPPPPQTW